MRQRARQMYVDGCNLRRIARHLKVHHTTVMYWMKAYAEALPPAEAPEQVKVVEMDEIYTFIKDKKTSSTS